MNEKAHYISSQTPHLVFVSILVLPLWKMLLWGQHSWVCWQHSILLYLPRCLLSSFRFLLILCIQLWHQRVSVVWLWKKRLRWNGWTSSANIRRLQHLYNNCHDTTTLYNIRSWANNNIPRQKIAIFKNILHSYKKSEETSKPIDYFRLLYQNITPLLI